MPARGRQAVTGRVALVFAVTAVGAAGCAGSQPGPSASAPPTTGSTAHVPALVLRQQGSVAAFVQVDVKGHAYLFQVDSGAAQTIIDSGVARKLGLESAGPGGEKSTIACRTSSQPVTITDWRLGSTPLPTITASAVRTQLPEKTKGKVAGLLGADVFDRFGRLTLDFRGRSVTLGGRAPTRGTSVPISVRRAPDETFVLAAATVSGRPAGFLVDTGAGSSTIDSRVAQRLGLRAAGRVRTVTAVSCPVRVQPVRIGPWSIGAANLPSTLALSSRSNITDKTHGTVVGLIGADVLSRYGRVTLDFRSQRLVLGG